MSFTRQQIHLQRERVLHLVLQRTRARKLGSIIDDDDGNALRLSDADRRAETLLENMDDEAEVLLLMLSAAAHETP